MLGFSILQTKKLPDIRVGFREGKGTRDQIANIFWITEKSREFQKEKKKNLPLFHWLCCSLCVGHNCDDGGLVTKSCLTLATPWTVAWQTPLFIRFSGGNTGVGCHLLLQEEQNVESSKTGGNTRPSYLSLEKPVRGQEAKVR